MSRQRRMQLMSNRQNQEDMLINKLDTDQFNKMVAVRYRKIAEDESLSAAQRKKKLAEVRLMVIALKSATAHEENDEKKI